MDREGSLDAPAAGASRAQELYTAALQAVRDELDKLATAPASATTPASAGLDAKCDKDGAAAKPRPVVRALRSGHSPSNFVVGDTEFSSFQSLLQEICDPEQAEAFVDLGCGRGEVVAAAALFNLAAGRRGIASVLGIDLMHYKTDECKRLCSRILGMANQTEAMLPSVDILEEDFTQVDWSEASVVYACATCFSEPLMELLREKCQQLRSGAKVVLLDREMDQSCGWTLLLEKMMRTSWGQGRAFAYRKE